MNLQHTDVKRVRPQYCGTPCVLCAAAAAMQITEYSADVLAASRDIRGMHQREVVDTDRQPELVQAFLRAAGLPIITEHPTPRAVDRSPEPSQVRPPNDGGSTR